MSPIYLTRRGIHPRTGREMARFYKLFLAPGLFGDWVVTREWGRIGQGGTVQVDFFPNAGAALLALQEFVRIKKKRGYERLEK